MKDLMIVIVEDDAKISELIKFNLNNEGYETRCFPCGESMLSSLPDVRSASLFIIDVMLPGINGFEILQKLKSDPNFALVPSMLLTGRSSESDKLLGFMIGADDYLTKPFSIRELMARFEAILRRQGLMAGNQFKYK